MSNIAWIVVGVLGGITLAYFLFGKKKEEKKDEKPAQKKVAQCSS